MGATLSKSRSWKTWGVVHPLKESWAFNFQSVRCKIKPVCSKSNTNLSLMQPLLDLFCCKTDETDKEITIIWREEYKSKMWLITGLWHRWGVMKPWPSRVLVYYIPACLLVTGVLIHSFSHHTLKISEQFMGEFNLGSELRIWGRQEKPASCPDRGDVPEWNMPLRWIPASPHGSLYLPWGTKPPCHKKHSLLPLPQRSQVHGRVKYSSLHNSAGEQRRETSILLGCSVPTEWAGTIVEEQRESESILAKGAGWFILLFSVMQMEDPEYRQQGAQSK